MALPFRRAVVTGAGGFIGSHLTELLLSEGVEVRALVHYNALGARGHLSDAGNRPGLEIIAGDVRDARCVRELVAGCDVVFHLAALIGIPYSYTAPESYLATNAGGTLNVLEACRDAGTTLLVHTSTSEAYGTALTTPMSEDHPLQAQSPYSASKIAADKLVESYHLSFALPAVTIRPFNTYGPRQSLRAVLPTIIAQALAPECTEIRLGSLDPVRDLTFVADTAQGFLAAAVASRERVVGHTFNLGVGEGISVGDLAKKVCATLGVVKPVIAESQRVRPAASEVRHLLSDNRRMREATGWQPSTSLDEGIRLTAQWIRPRLHELRPQEYAQ